MSSTTTMPGSTGEVHRGAARADSETIEQLIHQLDSKDGIVRQRARQRLVGIGRPAVRALQSVLPSADERLAWEAAKALDQIADPCTAGAFIDALEDPRGGISWLAGEGLIRLGRYSLEPLLEALSRRSDSAWLRRGAHHVLREMVGCAPDDVVLPVLHALDGAEPGLGVRVAAYNALRALHAEHQYVPKPDCPN
jgi:hypothetical protein